MLKSIGSEPWHTINCPLDWLGWAHEFINGFDMLLLMLCFNKSLLLHAYLHFYCHAYTLTCKFACMSTHPPTHSFYMNLCWQGHWEIIGKQKTCFFQNHSTGPSKAQNEWSNTRSMDLDGHMASSINLICVCLCFAWSFFAKSWFPKIDNFFLEKGLLRRNLMLGGQNSVARELFNRKKYPPAERPPNYGDEGCFLENPNFPWFFLCLGIPYAIPCLAWLGWACWCRDFSASAVCVQACLVGLLLACLGPTSMAGLPGLAVCLLSGALTNVLIGVHTYLHTYTHTYTMAYIPTCIHIYIFPYLHTHSVPQRNH